ncbi:MAG: hypothetical protein ABIQ16_17195 [Polyangiaceae bacterium]
MRPVTAGTVEAHGAELQAAKAVSERKKHVAKARTWRLREDSPFTLVAEGLKSQTDVATLGKTNVLYTAPCTWAPQSPTDHPDSFVLRAVEGDHFALPLPDSPPGVSGGGVTLLGRWPAQVYFRFSVAPLHPGAQYQFIHWDGRQWQTIPTDPARHGLEPFDIFDWYDGASLVTQTEKWHYTVTYRVEPFLVWGKSSHIPPDFSTLAFPKDERHEEGGGDIQYATLPTHELFVLNTLTTYDFRRTTVTVAYSTRAGALVLDKVVSMDHAAVMSQFSTGRLGQRDVVVAWGYLERFGKRHSWLQLYDGASSAKLPVPEAGEHQEGFADVWLAGGKLWARGGNRSKIWQFDGTSWSAFAQVEPGAELAWSAEDGSLWGVYLPALFRFEKDGRRAEVPFLAEPTKEFFGYRLFAAAPDDIWLFVGAAGNEELVFRTKKMTSILACE